MFPLYVLAALLLCLGMNMQESYSREVPTKEELKNMMPSLTQKLNENPNDFQSLWARAFAYEQLGNYQSAIADFNRALAIKPNKKELLSGRFATYLRMKDYTNALIDADSLIAVSPEPFAYSNRGIAYLMANRLDKATLDFSKAVQLDPKFALAWEGLCNVAFKAKLYQKCISYADTALSLDRGRLEALYYRGKSRQALGQSDLGKRDIDRAVSAGFKEDELQSVFIK